MTVIQFFSSSNKMSDIYFCCYISASSLLELLAPLPLLHLNIHTHTHWYLFFLLDRKCHFQNNNSDFELKTEHNPPWSTNTETLQLHIAVKLTGKQWISQLYKKKLWSHITMPQGSINHKNTQNSNDTLIWCELFTLHNLLHDSYCAVIPLRLFSNPRWDQVIEKKKQHMNNSQPSATDQWPKQGEKWKDVFLVCILKTDVSQLQRPTS